MLKRTERDLLLCAYAYPPTGGPTERRWAEFVRYLARRGWKIDVLTIRPSPHHPRYDPASLALIPDNVRVFRTPPGMAHRWKALAAEPARAPALWKRIVHGGYRRLLRPLMVPDRWLDWVPLALACGARLLRHTRYRLVISSSSPQSTHVAGYLLHRWSGRPWIGDWSDPLAFNPNLALHGLALHAARTIEGRLIGSMDRVIVSTEATARAYVAHYGPQIEPKLRVVSYGYTDEVAAIQPAPSPSFRILYAGIFLKQIRPPWVLFDALRQLRGLPVEVAIAGVMEPEFIDYAEHCGLNGQVKFLGQVAHRDAVALMKGSSAVLLFGNKGGLQLPGKVFDYIAARRPVLSVKFEEPDLAADLVEKHRRGLVVPADAGLLAEAIRQLYQWHAAGVLDQHFDLCPLDQYSWAGSSRAVEAILCELLS